MLLTPDHRLQHIVPICSQLCPVMAFKISRLAMFWIFSASSTPASGSDHHPLCRTLSDGEESQPTHFPSVYTCHGANDDAICTPQRSETSGASAKQVRVHETANGIAVLYNRLNYEKYLVTDEYLLCVYLYICLLYTSPSPRDRQKSRMPSSA